MPPTVQRPFKVADFRNLPEGPPYYQLINGELIMSPSPNLYHQIISRNIEFVLLKYLEKNPVGQLYHAPLDVFLTDENAFEPDIIFVANENAHILTDYVEGAPDLVVEILSPSTGRYDRDTKRKVYAETGVKELWLVFPKAQKIEIFHLPASRELPAATYGNAESFTSPLFPGLVLETHQFFKR